MANTRFKGANSGERLTLTTLSDSDMFQTRHLPGTVNDADKGVSKSLLQALPVAISSTAAATAAKVGTLAAESCPDFVLVSGRCVQVYFSAANTAASPSLNLYGTGSIPMVNPDGSAFGSWKAGSWFTLMYVSVTIESTLTERWVVVNAPASDEVALNNMNSVTSNAVERRLSGVSPLNYLRDDALATITYRVFNKVIIFLIYAKSRGIISTSLSTLSVLPMSEGIKTSLCWSGSCVGEAYITQDGTGVVINMTSGSDGSGQLITFLD